MPSNGPFRGLVVAFSAMLRPLTARPRRLAPADPPPPANDDAPAAPRVPGSLVRDALREPGRAGMRYQFVEWLHEFDSEPVAIIQELTDDGWEVRKIEVFPGGSVGLASGRDESGGSALAELPSPDLDAINRSPEFNGVAIGPRLFEALWREASRARPRP